MTHPIDKHTLGVPLWIVVGLMLAPTSAVAHDVTVSAHAHGTIIEGEARLHDGTPVRNAKVTAFDPAGEKIGETTTDEQGRFSFKARFRCDHRLLVDAGDGHGAECTVPAGPLGDSLPPRGGAPPASLSDHTSLEAIEHQLIHLQEELDRFEQQIRLRDVLGGIGYIVGIAGVAFYFLGIRRKES
ncbi:MAG: hypothetical protein A2V70_13385 [Planctomycetes bacterium RBG_13_63_9]|nr:MAG: hypothetical protein A2V70_13385 [Planctomycetes bacterium RBG_13_63_9]